MKLLEVTERQAITLYNEGIVVYLVTNSSPPDTAFNAFCMRKDCKDARLNYYIGGRNPVDITLEEYIRFIECNQIEQLRYYTFNSVELYLLPL